MFRCVQREGQKQQRPPQRVAVSYNLLLKSYAAGVYTYTEFGCLPTGTARLTTWFTRLRFVDVEGTSTELLTLEPLNRGLRLTAVGHFHKAKPTGTAGVAIGNDIDSVH